MEFLLIILHGLLRATEKNSGVEFKKKTEEKI
jgi:hypothetical protein